MPTLLVYPDCEKENLPIEICESSSDISISPVELEYPTMEIAQETEANDDATPILTHQVLEVNEGELIQSDVPAVASTRSDGAVLNETKPSTQELKRKRGRPAKAKTDQKSENSEAIGPGKAAVEKARGRKKTKAVPASGGSEGEQGQTMPEERKRTLDGVLTPTVSPELQAQIEIKSTMIASWVGDLR